jgi:hypothetical protein
MYFDVGAGILKERLVLQRHIFIISQHSWIQEPSRELSEIRA